MAFEPADPNFEARVRASFARQQVMATIGAQLTLVLPGEVVVEMAFQEHLTQQHGFIHAGIVTTILDSACGYAAFSLMPADAAVLSVEYKVNLLAPTLGERLIARGRVIRPGRTITVCSGDVAVLRDGQEQPVATMLATMMQLRGRPNLVG